MPNWIVVALNCNVASFYYKTKVWFLIGLTEAEEGRREREWRSWERWLLPTPPRRRLLRVAAPARGAAGRRSNACCCVHLRLARSSPARAPVPGSSPTASVSGSPPPHGLGTRPRDWISPSPSLLQPFTCLRGIRFRRCRRLREPPSVPFLAGPPAPAAGIASPPPSLPWSLRRRCGNR